MTSPNSFELASRRAMLRNAGLGIGSVALAWLLKQDRALAETTRPELEKRTFDLKERFPAKPAKARAMISLFMQGGPSHMDMFDPKPELTRLNGKPFPGSIQYDNAAQASSTIMGSPFKFSKQGKSGIEISEILPHLARIVDDICLIRSMKTGVNNHGQSINALNTGKEESGRPSLGSWLVYGLGSPSQNLPAYVALPDPAGLPVLGAENFSCGWLPSLYQGTVIRPREPRILNLDPPPHLKGAGQEKMLSFLSEINKEHLSQHPGELDLEARIASYELAARMQLAAREAMDIASESEATKKLYGLDDPVTAEYGARCLIARRLVERGVRFVQVFTGTQAWDHHHGVQKNLPNTCKKVDKPSAALVMDLKSRGLLESTVVHWGGEMGRLPVIQVDPGSPNPGRDHNTHGFSMWVAGGGFKGGMTYGETDEFGHRAVKDVVTHVDYHQTLLHVFGLDPNSLVYKRNGLPQSLIAGQGGRVVQEILA